MEREVVALGRRRSCRLLVSVTVAEWFLLRMTSMMQIALYHYSPQSTQRIAVAESAAAFIVEVFATFFGKSFKTKTGLRQLSTYPKTVLERGIWMNIAAAEYCVVPSA